MQLKPQWRRESRATGTDLIVGARLTQLTSAAQVSHNIYCEQRYCATDGSRVAFLRTVANEEQLWILNCASGETASIETELCGYPASDLHSDLIYYIRRRGAQRILIRVNLISLQRDELCDVSACPEWRWVYPTVSPDNQYLMLNYRVDARTYGIYRVDLNSGTGLTIHSEKDILNPHLQFDPGASQDVLVQWNRGGACDETGNISQLVGDEGATLYLLDKDGRNRRDLPIGRPHTALISGHQCWIGTTGNIIAACVDNTIHIITPKPATCRSIPIEVRRLGHVSVSTDGQVFVIDDFANGRLHLGSVKTGTAVPVCDSLTSCGELQHTHAHAYLLPDNKSLVFNSDRSGVAQVWMAELPTDAMTLVNQAQR